MDYETEKKMRKAFDINKIDKSKPTGSYENPQAVSYTHLTLPTNSRV